MKMYVAGHWVDKNAKIEVVNPFDGRAFDTVPRGDLQDVHRALESAVRGAKIMVGLLGYERYRVLKRAAEFLEARADGFARTITLEEGKTIGESRAEVSRAVQTLILSGEEAKRLHGETVPFDGASGTVNKLGFTLRVPCGVVVAITPFNYPLSLVCHKVGPAIAAGNAVVLKPATDTPLSALRLTKALLDAGLPSEGLQCLTGPGADLGEALCSDKRVRKITFTGSRDVGERICRMAGIKKVTMELGGNSPVIVMPDADLRKAAAALAVSGYLNAGQVCLSTQRVLAAAEVYSDFLKMLRQAVEAITTGDPLDEMVRMGPMIRERDAIRVQEWVREATENGARLLTGGTRQGALYAPTIVADVKPEMRISRDELFGPAVAVAPFDTLDQAIALANDTSYGLAAGVFTENLEWAMRFVREVHAGNLMVNWGTVFRVDLMPHGGLKESGFGKEGPRYAVEELTELKLACFHLRD